MRAFRRPSVAVLVLLMLCPTFAFGQATKAGVVSTLQGTVTATRTTAPQPVPLKFKDDVFLQDLEIRTDQMPYEPPSWLESLSSELVVDL